MVEPSVASARRALQFRLRHLWIWMTLASISLGMLTAAWGSQWFSVLAVRMLIVVVVGSTVGLCTGRFSRSLITCFLAILLADLAWAELTTTTGNGPWDHLDMNVWLLGVPFVCAASSVRSPNRAVMISVPLAILFGGLLGVLSWTLLAINHRPGMQGTGFAQAMLFFLFATLGVLIPISTVVTLLLLHLRGKFFWPQATILRCYRYLAATYHGYASTTETYRPPHLKSLAKIDTAPHTAYHDEPIEIEGIVAESGGSGERVFGYSVQYLEFAAWRKVGGPVIQRKLLLLRPAKRSEDFTEDFTPYSARRVRILLEAQEERSILLAHLPLAQPDAELVAVGEELQKPVVVASKLLGELSLNRRLGQYAGEATWNGQTVPVFLTPNSDGSLDQALELAESLWSDQAGWQQKVNAFAVQELLPTKNDDWLQDDEAPLTPAQFIERMSLTLISLNYPTGGFAFWHDDGDLFSGHSIEIAGNDQDGLVHADIPG